jgi:predicted TIM-barrel fold metal-dependent hydrolase
MNRRSFIKGLSLTGLGVATTAPGLMEGVSSALTRDPAQAEGNKPNLEWGNPVVDMHFHCRNSVEANLRHLDGAGIQRAALLTQAPQQIELAKQTISANPDRFFLFTSADDTKPDAVDILKGTRVDGTRGFGELSGWNMALDGPEMGLIYDLAAEMQVPVLIHYQDYMSADGSHPFQSPVGFTRPQFPRLENALKTHPKTIFIGHGPAFWGNLGPEGDSLNYPMGPVKPGGLTARLLSDYPNLYGGLDASSGINALHRDPDFSRTFLVKHQDKLLFGSDCGCSDGHGGGGRYGAAPAASATTVKHDNPMVNLVAGNCLARVQLTQLKQLASPEVFRKITWENGTKLVRLA